MENAPNPPEFIPPLTPPPVIRPPAPPRKSRGWMIAAIILFVVLVFSLFGNLTQFVANAFSFKSGLRTESFGSGRDSGPRLEEFTVENNDSPNKIAVITLDGIITSHDADPAGNNMIDVIQAQLDRARDDKRVKAVILKMDSPGGEVLASDDIYKAIRDFETDEPAVNGKPGRRGKPVICSMGSLAASGGYYISSGCRWIVANELTITGSIGVIMHGYNYRGLMDKVGVLPMTYKSGKFKDMLSPDRETNNIPPEEHAMVQGLIDETFQKFKGVVRAGRAAIMMPGLFALCTQVLHSAPIGSYAAFGCFAMLLLVEYTGPMVQRLRAHLELTFAWAVFICLGTLASRYTWVAVLSTVAIGFLVLFLGVVSSVLASSILPRRKER